MESFGQPAYRALSLYHALYSEKRFDFAIDVPIYPRALRERSRAKLRSRCPKSSVAIESSDGSIRYVLALPAKDLSKVVSEPSFPSASLPRPS